MGERHRDGNEQMAEQVEPNSAGLEHGRSEQRGNVEEFRKGIWQCWRSMQAGWEAGSILQVGRSHGGLSTGKITELYLKEFICQRRVR